MNFRQVNIGIVLILLLLSGCTLGRTIWYNVPGYKDHLIFPSRNIAAPPVPRDLVLSHTTAFPPLQTWARGKFADRSETQEEFFHKTGTVALLVLKGDTLQHEFYAPGHDSTTIFTSYSMGKVFVSTLAGIALDEGDIDSMDQAVADFLPQFRKDSALREITIRHVLQMTTGLKSGEALLNPFNRLVKMFYGKDMDRALKKIEAEVPAGSRFKYSNLNTQLLARILRAATGKTLSALMEEKIWIPSGMEAPANWSLDHEGGEEKAFCCLNARARDFARFGLVFLNRGLCEGSEVLPNGWVCDATQKDTSGGSSYAYQYYWYTTAAEEDYYGEGLVGQFLYVCPATQTVIVRLGRKVLNRATPWYQIFRTLAGWETRPEAIQVDRAELKALEGHYIFDPDNFGDSSLVGKSVRIVAKNGYLKVKPDFRKNFELQAMSPRKFFHEKDGRYLEFLFEEGEPKKIRWSRNGRRWLLYRN